MKARIKKKLAKKQACHQRIPDARACEPVLQFTEFAKECWRIQRLLPGLDGNRKTLVLKSSVEKMIAMLAEADIEIDDPEGVDYRDGMTVKVTLFEDSINLPSGKTIITETLEPGIYVGGRLASQAKVIVTVGKGPVK
jgi:hypothetical protein